MARAVGLSHMAISRIWDTFGLEPHRSETFKLSNDPQLVDKVRDIVGLYLDPPAHAAVFCVDEKPQIRALERTQPLPPLQPGQVERRTLRILGRAYGVGRCVTRDRNDTLHDSGTDTGLKQISSSQA